MDLETLIERFDRIDPNNESLYDVDAIIEDLYKLGRTGAQKGIAAMFRIFERLTEGSYDSVLWSVLHAIEGLGDYEEALVRSVQRKPNGFNLLMVNRILNTEKTGDKFNRFLKVMQNARHADNLDEYLKADLDEYLEMHIKP